MTRMESVGRARRQVVALAPEIFLLWRALAKAFVSGPPSGLVLFRWACRLGQLVQGSGVRGVTDTANQLS